MRAVDGKVEALAAAVRSGKAAAAMADAKTQALAEQVVRLHRAMAAAH